MGFIEILKSALELAGVEYFLSYDSSSNDWEICVDGDVFRMHEIN